MLCLSLRCVTPLWVHFSCPLFLFSCFRFRFLSVFVLVSFRLRLCFHPPCSSFLFCTLYIPQRLSISASIRIHSPVCIHTHHTRPHITSKSNSNISYMTLPTLPQFLFSTLNEARNGLSFQEISFLTFQAVVQVFLICLSGFWAAQSNLLTNEGVKIISRLNVDLFTPALIFSKLASSLSLKKLLEVIIIPILYAVTTLVSYYSSILVSRWLELTEPESNFVTAMSVFGNSNSLPVSLTLALAYSLPDLEWDDIPNDTPDKIASRGLIYLLIFQQLGQMLRWSWGYNKLLAKQPDHVIFYGSTHNTEDDHDLNTIQSMNTVSSSANDSSLAYNEASNLENRVLPLSIQNNPANISKTLGDQPNSKTTSSSSNTNVNVNYLTANYGHNEGDEDDDECGDDDSTTQLIEEYPNATSCGMSSSTSYANNNQHGEDSEDKEVERPFLVRALLGFYNWMNPPLWSMLAAMFVASIPPLKAAFYENNGFVQHTLSSAIKQLGGVSIPLILVVLGANLAPSSDIPPACPHYKRMILGSLLGRMVLPSLILLPMIVLSVKYISLSIMEDPIFLITSFLLITSPPAIQLSQICQLNELYQKEMAGVLFYGYAILTLPVTIVVVVTCIEAMKWSQA